jgi:hypothetical protein
VKIIYFLMLESFTIINFEMLQEPKFQHQADSSRFLVFSKKFKSPQIDRNS